MYFLYRCTLIAVLLSFTDWARCCAGSVDFVRDVRPILQKHCYACHGPGKQKSGLRLDIKAAALAGGESHGPLVSPGEPNNSPLIELVTSHDPQVRMPPEGRGLAESELAILQRWVQEGAVWPEGVDLAVLEDRRQHWSFQPVDSPTPPEVRDTHWARSSIDRFILARLESVGLEPSPETDRVTWLRRVCLDLTGLPPTPALVQQFLRSTAEDAYERVVDQLLQSPRYGERWAQHWLDVVRYADTHGFEVNTERPNAWPYRDYVIEAFNNDTPYDQFVREQMVGDAHGQDTATGFLITASVLLPGQIGKDEPSIRLARQDAIDEIVVNIGSTFLGLSVGCARCHDHKFDPITAKEYYGMQAFVAGVEYGERELYSTAAQQRRQELQRLRERLTSIDEELAKLEPFATVHASSNETATENMRRPSSPARAAVNARRNTDRIVPTTTQQVRLVIEKTNSLEPCLDELEVFDEQGRNIALATFGTRVQSSGDNISPNRHELRFVNDGQYGNHRSWMSNEVGKGWVALEFDQPRTIHRVVWGRDRLGEYADRLAIEYRIEIRDASGWKTVASHHDRLAFQSAKTEPNATEISTAGLSPQEVASAQQLRTDRKGVQAAISLAESETKAFAGIFRSPDKIHVLYRGDPEQPKEPVPPSALSILGHFSLPLDAPENDRRQALSGWLASHDNPLTARVMVNRIWQGHFGVGLVETASDFGRTGSKPSHPELLDWLATQLMRSGWSMKQLHRLIILSATYRQSSRHREVAAGMDADNRWLWKFPTRRLEAECMRDSMLFVSGQLNLEMYGRGFDLFDKRGGLTGFNPRESFGSEGLRRMIYAHKVRREREGVFGAFDCPDAGQSTARRRESTTPIQALNLFNSRFTLDQSLAFSKHVQGLSGNAIEKQIVAVYRTALSRDPSDQELSECRLVVQEFGLETLCRVIFNSNEFLFVP